MTTTTNELPRVDIREHQRWRRLLRPLCTITRHRPAWIIPLVPNPYATDSRILGCSRCSTTTAPLPLGEITSDPPR